MNYIVYFDLQVFSAEVLLFPVNSLCRHIKLQLTV